MKNNKEREIRKQLQNEWVQKNKLEFENSLPISREIFIQLFDYLDQEIGKVGCDDSLRLTHIFLNENKIKNKIEI